MSEIDWNFWGPIIGSIIIAIFAFLASIYATRKARETSTEQNNTKRDVAKQNNEINTSIADLRNETERRIAILSKRLDGQNARAILYYTKELECYPELMKLSSNYRWTATEPDVHIDMKSYSEFPFEDWNRRYNEDLNKLRDFVAANCAFIYEDIENEIKTLTAAGIKVCMRAMSINGPEYDPAKQTERIMEVEVGCNEVRLSFDKVEKCVKKRVKEIYRLDEPECICKDVRN